MDGMDQDQEEAAQVVSMKFYRAVPETGRLPQFYKIQPISGSGSSSGNSGYPPSASGSGFGSGSSSELGRLIFDNVDLKRTSIIEEVYRKGNVACVAGDIRRLRVISLEFYPLPSEAVASYRHVCYLDISSFIDDLSTVFHLAGKLPMLGLLNFNHGSICDIGSKNMDQEHVDVHVKAEPLYADSLVQNSALMSLTLIVNPDKFYKENFRRQRAITDRIYIVLKYVMMVCPNLARAELAIPFEVNLTTFRRELPGVSVKLLPFAANTTTTLGSGVSGDPGMVTAQMAQTTQRAQAASPDAGPGDFGNETRRKQQPYLRPAWTSSMRMRDPAGPSRTSPASASGSGFGAFNVVFPSPWQRPRRRIPTQELIDLDDSDSDNENAEEGNMSVGLGRGSLQSKQRRTGH